jgi:hypothetical protein
LQGTGRDVRLSGFYDPDESECEDGKPLPNVRPSDKAVKKIKARLTDLTKRELTCIPLGDVVRM